MNDSTANRRKLSAKAGASTYSVTISRSRRSTAEANDIILCLSGIASQFWQRYEFTGDKQWLRAEAYPMIKGVAEFYANFPNLKKESDGKYHIYHVNRIESDWDSQDTSSELGAMRSIFPMAISVSQILGVDEELRPKWRDIVNHLASPAPGSGNRGNFDQTKTIYAKQVTMEVSAASGLPAPRSGSSAAGSEGGGAAERRPGAMAGESGQTNAAATGRTGRDGTIAAGANGNPGGAADGRERRRGSVFGNFVGSGEGAIEPLGSEPQLKRRFLGFNMTGGFIDPSGDGGAQIFRNRLRLREGPGAIDAEHLGGLAFGIHESLLISTVDDTLTNSTIEVFPAWPKDWAVNFKLLARGGAMVTATQRGGKVLTIQLEPTMAATIHLKNPWGSDPVKVSHGGTTEMLGGTTLAIATKPGEVIRINP